MRLPRWALPGFGLLLAGCTAMPVSSPAATPTPTPGVGECGARAASYPGWPGPGKPVGKAEIVPIIVSGDLAIGANRLLVSLVDERNRLLASPDLPVSLALYDLADDPAQPVETAAASFMWTLEPELGLYRAQVEFRCAGAWGLEVTAGTGSAAKTARAIFEVQPASTSPAIGAPAPPSDTPVAADAAGIAAISTDPEPDPRFYRRSVKATLAAGQPFVLIFSTPAFCKTRTCGPALDIVKRAAAKTSAEIGFIHVEPYRLEVKDGALQPVFDEQNQLQVVPSVGEWGLRTEPYVFVVDADGRVAAKFEGVVGEDELLEAIGEVAV
jgi:hypothetical protein